VSNQINSKNKPLKSYDAGDMSDVYGIAHESTEWLSTLLSQIKKETKNLQEELKQQGIYEGHFHAVSKLLDLSEFMADERIAYFKRLHTEHAQEWEADKKAVTL